MFMYLFSHNGPKSHCQKDNIDFFFVFQIASMTMTEKYSALRFLFYTDIVHVIYYVN